MDNEPKRRPRFWPLLFLVAFALGTLLWVLWMAQFIRKTRANRVDGFFVPMAGQSALTTTNATNHPNQTN